MALLTSRSELAETPANGDLLHIVDVSDTTDNAAGSSKKITTANLLASKADSSHTHAASDITSGTLVHERGGLEGDVSAYSGLVGISGGSTTEVNSKSELEALIADVSDFAEADGDVYSGAHDFGGATSVEIPNGTTVTVDAAGEIAMDTNGDGSTVTTGVIRGYDGSQTLTFFGATNYPTSDNDVMVYDSGTNAVKWEAQSGSGGGISNVVEDTTPQFGGQVDVNGFGLGDGTLELLAFTETASAVNHIGIKNNTTTNAPEVQAVGDDTNIDLALVPKGTGTVKPSADVDLDGDNVIVTATAGGADTTTSGTTSSLTAGENVSFGEIAYMKSDGKLWKADADGTSTYPAIAMAAASITADNAGIFLLQGFARNDAWEWTVGGLIYLSDTAGALTQTAPSTSGDQVQVVGVATHADRMYFNPQLVLVEVA